MASVKPRAATPSRFRYSQLSVPRQALVRLCQRLNYGSIEGLCIRDAEPVLNPSPLVLVDVKLDADEAPRPEIDLPDFALCNEVRRLMGHLDKIKTGMIEQIEVRAGVPRRILFRGSLPKARTPLSQAGPPSQADIDPTSCGLS